MHQYEHRPASITGSARVWLSNNNSKIEADSIWRSIRGDWLNDLEEPKSTFEDLETICQMVNVEGVTTSFAGKGAWYRQHLKSPFDIVALDEISKATPPEIFYLYFWEKSPFWLATIGSCLHIQRSNFKESRRITSGDEIEDERFSRREIEEW